MKRSIALQNVLSALLAASLMLALLPSSAFASSVAAPPRQNGAATLTVLEGSVTIVPHSTGAAQAGFSGDTLGTGDRVATANPGAALVTFFDGSEIELGPSSEIALRSVEPSADGGILILIVQSAGTTVNRVAALGAGSRYEVQTPNTVSLVRGTVFSNSVTRTPLGQVSEEVIAVEVGEVDVRVREEAQSADVPAETTLQAGQSLRIVPPLGGLEEVGSSVPVAAVGLSGALEVSGGVAHSLARTSGGRVWAWGNNFSGQLGVGSNANSIVPVPIADLEEVTSIATGLAHSVAARSDGTVWAWGWNSGGQLGDGTNDSSTTPVRVVGLDSAVAIGAGLAHSVALRSDGSVWAWGENRFGQLGNGTFDDSNLPVQVVGLEGVVSLGVGHVHSLAVKADGTVWCWGNNDSGQLGDGTTTHRSVPHEVAGMSDVASAAAGAAHSLVVKSDGSVWGWGSDRRGELGDGPSAVSSVDGVTASRDELLIRRFAA